MKRESELEKNDNGIFKFKYLEVIINVDENMEKEGSHRLHEGWKTL